MRYHLFRLIMFMTAGCLPALALDIGDTAPPLDAEVWIQGEELNLDQLEEGEYAVVEFWATWCGPCRVTIPHLNELYSEFKEKGIHFVSISDEDQDTIRQFMKSNTMDYPVAADTDRSMYDTFMKNVSGIPHAFVLDAERQVIWHGHPMSELENVLTQLHEGTYDAAAQARIQELHGQIQQSYQAGNVEACLAALNQLIELKPMEIDYYQMRTDLLYQQGEYRRIKESFHEMKATFSEDPQLLNALAWMILELPFECQDLDMAHQSISQAMEMTDQEDGYILDIAARVAYALGRLDRAIELQQLAIEHAEPTMEEFFKDTLSFYQHATAVADRVYE